MTATTPSASMLWAAWMDQGFSGELVDDVEQLDAAQAGGLVELEVQGPQVVGALGA